MRVLYCMTKRVGHDTNCRAIPLDIKGGRVPCIYPSSLLYDTDDGKITEVLMGIKFSNLNHLILVELCLKLAEALVFSFWLCFFLNA